MTGETHIVPDFGDDDFDPYGWEMSGPYDDDDLFVCMVCGRFIPCRRHPEADIRPATPADHEAQRPAPEPPAPAVAPASPSRGSVDGSGGSQGLTEAHSVADRLRAIADVTDMRAIAKGRSRTQRAAAKAAARAYRLAADMIEEEA